ncbi:MAG: sigma-54 dependent transcriptional regulator [Desulfobacterales bacterium]
MFPSILIVDDEPSILQSLSGILADEGFESYTASNGYEALKRIEEESPDLVLLDIWMPGLDGIETLKEIKRRNPHIQVVIITGHGNIETAVKAVKMGAFDLIEKPLSIDKIMVTINNSLNFRRLEEENRYLRRKALEKNSLTGNSPNIQTIKNLIGVSAPTDKWIFITGENGTGKELAARTIHHLSPRADSPLIDINCAALSEELMSLELFGTEKGSENGTRKKIGKLELADDGTLFFDEICDMSLHIQGKLLRVFQEKKFERTGGSRSIDMKARIIASTNKDIEHEIKEGRFREDLYYRLNEIPIHIPPLRERIEDIPLLVETFLSQANQKYQKSIFFTAEALKRMSDYSWPGNVRELKTFVERLVIIMEKDAIDESDVLSLYNSENQDTSGAELNRYFSINDLRSAKKAFVKDYIQLKMAEHDHDVKRTAKAIGVKPDYVKKFRP